MSDDVHIRAAGSEDRRAILDLGVRSLGWSGDDRDAAFFSWKHDENPFGPSPAWVATIADRIVGFRTFLRWELRHPGGDTLHLVRAVDTATDPDHQGKGIFRTLTLTALDELRAMGVDAVFNTPNDPSRPGYLKMGWVELGRPSIGLWARPTVWPRVVRSRVPAELWSQPTPIGRPLAATAQLPEQRPSAHWSTPRDRSFLDWRYGFEPLQYRCVGDDSAAGIFRVRLRGPNREVALCEWLGRPRARILRRLVADTGDYAIAIGLGLRHGVAPLPGQGPIVTWRTLNRDAVPRLGDLDFSLGDLELF